MRPEIEKSSSSSSKKEKRRASMKTSIMRVKENMKRAKNETRVLGTNC